MIEREREGGKGGGTQRDMASILGWPFSLIPLSIFNTFASLSVCVCVCVSEWENQIDRPRENMWLEDQSNYSKEIVCLVHTDHPTRERCLLSVIVPSLSSCVKQTSHVNPVIKIIEFQTVQSNLYTRNKHTFTRLFALSHLFLSLLCLTHT